MDSRLPNSVQVGKAIRKKRKENFPDLSLEDFALDAGITPGYLSSIEHGGRKFSWEVLASIIEALGIDLADLITTAQALSPEKSSTSAEPNP